MEIANIALADARELVEVKTGCCRCCWGEGFKFQRTVGEYNHDREKFREFLSCLCGSELLVLIA